MMSRSTLMPLAMGIIMGLMAMMMLHSSINGAQSGSQSGQSSALWAFGFIALHVAVAALLALAVYLGLHRRFDRLAGLVRHVHNARHLRIMALSALATAALIHLGHGALPWI